MKRLHIIFFTLLCLLGLGTVAHPQTRFTTERKLHLKTLDQDNMDSFVTWTGSMIGKQSQLSFMVGYGQTLTGNGWLQPKNSWGNVPFGSGMVNSPLYQAYLMAGPEYAPGITSFDWGRNGLGMSLTGSFGKFSLGGAYSGYNGLASFQFNGSIGTFTGRGLVVMKENKIDQLRTDMEIKF